jgi:recombinational DNA repair protein (RecF pathway)
MRVECSKCGNLDDTSARTVVLPEFLCRECTQATEDESVPESEDNSADEMLADMQIQLEQANNKIADLETSRDNERRRGDLYQGWYRETLHKYPAEMPELVGLLDEATNRLCSLLVRHGVRPAIWTW